MTSRATTPSFGRPGPRGASWRGDRGFALGHGTSQPIEDLLGRPPEIDLDRLSRPVVEDQHRGLLPPVDDLLRPQRHGHQISRGDPAVALEGRATRRLTLIHVRSPRLGPNQSHVILLYPGLIPRQYCPGKMLSGSRRSFVGCVESSKTPRIECPCRVMLRRGRDAPYEDNSRSGAGGQSAQPESADGEKRKSALDFAYVVRFLYWDSRYTLRCSIDRT